MTHSTGSCKTCDWCGEQEPEAGMFDRSPGVSRASRTILCPDCSPDDKVERGTFFVFDFTMSEEDNFVADAIEGWFEPLTIGYEWIGIKHTGLETSGEGHTRCKLMVTADRGLNHYSLDKITDLRGVINSANGDPERSNCSLKLYNWNVADKLQEMEDPEVFTINTK